MNNFQAAVYPYMHSIIYSLSTIHYPLSTIHYPSMWRERSGKGIGGHLGVKGSVVKMSTTRMNFITRLSFE